MIVDRIISCKELFELISKKTLSRSANRVAIPTCPYGKGVKDQRGEAQDAYRLRSLADYGFAEYYFNEFMALFGAPVIHERDPERALLAALAMMEALLDFNAQRGTDLGLHCGINTGVVIAGSVELGQGGTIRLSAMQST